MAAYAREHVYAVVESAFGTPKTSPVLDTDACYFNLPESDSFTSVMTPVFQETPFGGGLDTPLDVQADNHQTNVSWKGQVYPSLQWFLLKWALSPVGSSGTTPWTTTEPDGDLPSASLYHYWKPRGLTAVRKRVSGAKCMSLEISASRDDPKVKFSVQAAAIKEVGNTVDSSSDPDATEFPAPADTSIPTSPYLFSHSSSNLSVGGAAITNYRSVSVKITNKLDVLTFEGKFPSVISFLGRRCEVTFQRLLTTATNYRTFFQGVTDKATYVKFDNGAKSFKIDLGAKCHVTAYTTQLGLGKEFLETITMTGRYSLSAGTDLTLTLT